MYGGANVARFTTSTTHNAATWRQLSAVIVAQTAL